MHQPEDVNITYIPHDFKVASKLFSLPLQGFLQHFIDHVCFYNLLFETKVDAYFLATRTLSLFSFEKGREKAEILSQERGFSEIEQRRMVALIKKIGKIAANPRLSDKQCRKRATLLTQKLYHMFEPNGQIVKSKILYLNEEETLTLTSDFCLACEIECISPVEHLTNFMERISLSRMDAQRGLGKQLENPAYDFYCLAKAGETGFIDKGSLHPHSAIMSNFIEEIQELRLALFIYRSVDQREERYKKTYEKYYHQILEREKNES